MFLQIFLTTIVVFAFLACIGTNGKGNKWIAAFIAVAALVLLVIVVVEDKKAEETKVTAVAPETGKIEVNQNTWGTITVTDETGVTREYQGCINITGTYPYATYEYMGLCVRMDAAINIAEWSPGMYKLYYEEGKEAYWKAKEEQKETEKELSDNE